MRGDAWCGCWAKTGATQSAAIASSRAVRRFMRGSLYRPVKAHQHRRRDGNADLLRSAAVEYEGKPRDVLDGQVAGRRTGKNPLHELCRFASDLPGVYTVADKRAARGHGVVVDDHGEADRLRLVDKEVVL